MSEQKRLRRSTEDRIVLGVCGGIAVYFNTDPVLIRAVYVLLTIFTGLVPGVISYVALAIIMPEEGKGTN